jgi:hypothetical protein
MALLSRGEGLKKVTATNTGTNGGVSATLTHAAGQRIAVTHISGSSDAAAVVTIESPSGTVLWQKRFAAAFSFSESFHYGEIESSLGVAGDDTTDVLVKVSASTTHSEANIAGLQSSQG